ncbi:MAG TPA: SseB family protein [Actinotalea sp.]
MAAPEAGLRSLPPTSAFAGDDGRADPALADALRPDGGSLEAVVRALATARVLVPVTAELEQCEVGPRGLAEDKQASAGVAALRAPDGRTALPVFSSVAALAAWSPLARPVPAMGPVAAASARHEGWELMVVDPAGAAVVVPRPAVVALAEGRPWEAAVRDGAVRSDVREAVLRAALAVERVLAAEAVPGTRAEVAVVLALPAGLDRAGLDAVAAAVGASLAAEPLVASEVDSLELRVVLGDPSTEAGAGV